MRSFSSSFLSLHRPFPAPFAAQTYAKKKTSDKGTDDTLGVVASEEVDEKKYARGSDPSWRREAATEEEFARTIPAGDPYHLERTRAFTAGGDFRYLVQAKLANTSGATETKNWLMGVDFGVRARPVQRHGSMVLEARYLNGPDMPSLESGVTREARIRSAYVLVDDIPLNSYAMYGLYRPMFGLYDGNHYSISSTVSGLNQRAVYKSLGVGMAPNVPFFNVNIVSPMAAAGFDQSSGFVANVGARWVTLGASLVVSYWNTKAPEGGVDLLRRMIALSGGLSYERLVWNSEVLFVRKEFAPDAFDSGIVYTNQLLYRVWREVYLTGSYANSNLALTLKEGSADELTFGAKMFALAGTEFDFLWSNRNSRVGALSNNVKSVQFHAHLFF